MSNYCPYCNSRAASDLTEEHVIPQSIGGDSRTVIRVCTDCNSTIGRNVDTKLSSDGWMRLNGLFAGGTPNRHDRIESVTTLKDGRKLEGYSYVITTKNGIFPAFEPKKTQPDGSSWISEDAAPQAEKLPPAINVFRREMVEYWGYSCPPARLSGMEPAILKILLGIAYMDLGQVALESPAFDAIRFSLSGTIHGNISHRWLDKPMRWSDNSTIRNHEHAVYFECTDSKVLKAGVALFGTAILFDIQPFECFVPKRHVRWDGRRAPTT